MDNKTNKYERLSKEGPLSLIRWSFSKYLAFIALLSNKRIKKEYTFYMERLRKFFLKNSNQKQVIIKNTFWLVLAEIITRLLKLLLIIAVARILGATEYGKFTFALAFVSLFGIFADMGIGPIVTRDLSQKKEKEREFPTIITLKLFLGFLCFILIYAISFFITPDPLVRKVIWVLGAYVVASNFSEIIFAFFRAFQKMEYEAWAKISQAVFSTGVGFLMLFKFPSIQGLSMSYFLTSFFASLFLLLIFSRKFIRIKILFNKTIWISLLKKSWPLALIGIFATVYNSIDSVMMGYWGQITETGWYNAAYRVIGIALIPAGLVSQVFYPAVSSLFKKSTGNLQKIWSRQIEIMTFLAIPIVVGVIGLAPKIIQFVYGKDFLPGTLSLKILIIAVGIIFLSDPFNQILVVADKQKKIFLITMIGAFVNILLNFLLIPTYSLNGAAIATTTTYLLVFLMLFRTTIKLTRLRPLSTDSVLWLAGSLISSAIMYLIITLPFIYSVNVVFVVLIGSLVYLSFFSLFAKINNLSLLSNK